MASKRAFLSVDVENMESGNNREFEEPDVEPEKIDRKTEPDDKKDRFGPVPEVSGKEFLRNKKNEGKTTDHVRLSSHLKHTRKRDRKVAQKDRKVTQLWGCEVIDFPLFNYFARLRERQTDSVYIGLKKES